MSYRVTVTLEDDFENKGPRWVARDDSGDWRSTAHPAYTSNAIDALRGMFHTDEVENVQGDSKKATATILTGE